MDKEDKNEILNRKLRTYFDGKIVRKDLTKSIKEGANVPIYVLEFLLGQYCSSDDPSIIEEGVSTVKRILADNYVRPDEAQKILSLLRQRGSHTVIDKITVNLNIKKDTYEAEFSNLGINAIPISEDYPSKFDRLLCGGIWCIVQLEYEYIEEERNAPPIHIRKLTPIQMPHIDIDELKQARKAFTKEEWISVLLRSVGMEPDTLTETMVAYCSRKENNGCLLLVCCHLWKIILTYVNSEKEAQENLIYIKKFLRTVYLFLVDKRQ